MKTRIAVLTGLGALSQEVNHLAESLPHEHVCYAIEPWFPQLSSMTRRIAHPWAGASHDPGIVQINPFLFEEIERVLTAEAKTTHMFFTGDFPSDRFRQASFYGGRIERFGDDLAVELFNQTPTELTPPVRYFLALGLLLDRLKIERLLACQIFPQLNVRAGCATVTVPPAKILRSISRLFLEALQAVAATKQSSYRLSQAAVIDEGEQPAVERLGTDSLVREVGRRRRKSFPILVKPPSVEFDPALDQPTIGPKTMDECAAAGIRGVLFCAETTTFVQREEAIRVADSRGVFLYGMPFSQLCELYEQSFPRTWARNRSIAPLHR